MSAPTPSPATSPVGVPIGVRLVGAVAFAALGFVAMWQGFGLAGYGTDAHAARVIVVVVPLFAAGIFAGFSRPWKILRLFAAAGALALAGYLWWTEPSSHYRSAVSLRDAVEKRDAYKAHPAQPTVEDFEQHGGSRNIGDVCEQYPSLMGEVAEDHKRWLTGVEGDIVARYDRATADDLTEVARLRKTSDTFAQVHPPSQKRIDEAQKQWLARASQAKADELNKLAGADWDGFNRGAPGRKALAEAYSACRDQLDSAERFWIMRSVTTATAHLLPNQNPDPKRVRETCRAVEKQILEELRTIDTSAGRFRQAREALFAIAHDAARTEVYRHLDAARYDSAFGVARAHVVDWNATAMLLGPDEVKKLDSLRETCEVFDAFASKAAKPPEPLDVAPAPRPKP